MKKYEVVEIVYETLRRERVWQVDAISEQDAIRQVIEGEAAENYKGRGVNLESTKGPTWRVDGAEVEFAESEAVPVEDEFTDIGGHN